MKNIKIVSLSLLASVLLAACVHQGDSQTKIKIEESCHTCFDAPKQESKQESVKRSAAHKVAIGDVAVYSKDGKTKIGTIIKGFGGDEAGTIEDKIILKIKGFKKDGDEKNLYGDSGFAAAALTLDSEKITSDMLEVAVLKSDLTDKENELWSKAEFTYYDNCSMCHAAHNPKEHTIQEWEGIYESMKAFAMPTEADDKLIWEYLKAHSKGSFALSE